MKKRTKLLWAAIATVLAATAMASPAMAVEPNPPRIPAPAPAAGVLVSALNGAVAAPSAQREEAAAQAAAVPLESSAEEKVRAAAVVGVVAPDSWLVLSDRDFVFRIWQSATGPEVRAGAELALAAGTSAGCAECTVYIRSGIHDAQSRDIANEVRDATAARLAREAKQRAAATVGIVASPEMLILSDRDFVFAIYEQATGRRVKEAALAAFGGNAEQQAAFIATGIETAHAQDQQDRIDADQQASEAEKERLRARDAKSRAAAVLGIVATEEILVLTDDNFIRLILDRSAAAPEVNAAALAALRNADAGARTAFITTGIHEANQRDIDNVLRARAAEDRRLVGEIRTRAANGRVRLALASAAAQALAGSDEAVATFLRVGQYQNLTQSLRASTPRSSAWYVSGHAQSALHADPAGGPNAAFAVRNGLADANCFTFESVAFPTWFLTVRGTDVLLVQSDGSATFRGDATWCSRLGMNDSGVSLESFSVRGKFMRNVDQRLKLADGSSATALDQHCGYAAEVSWRVEGANPTATQGAEDVLGPYCQDAIFNSGMELGDPQPFRDVVDTGAAPRGGIQSVGPICCNLPGPELRLDGFGAYGRSSVMYSGNDQSSVRSRAYMRAFRMPTTGNFTLTSTSRLSYWIYPQSPSQFSLVNGYSSSCVAVDLLFSDNTALRNFGLPDTRGVNHHPQSQCGALYLDRWNYVEVPLGALANGRRLSEVSIGWEWDPYTGGYRGMIDEIMISR